MPTSHLEVIRAVVDDTYTAGPIMVCYIATFLHPCQIIDNGTETQPDFIFVYF